MEDEEQLRGYAEVRGVPILREASHKKLASLVEKYKPKHILEIGTAIGYSGITMLENCDGNLVTIELMQKSSELAKQNFVNAGLENRVTVINGDAKFVLTEMICDDANLGKFDFVFLDGAKGQYIKMLESILMLLAPGGILVADNVMFRGYIDGSVKAPRRFKTIVKRLQEFIKTCCESDELKVIELDKSEDGMLICKKEKL